MRILDWYKDTVKVIVWYRDIRSIYVQYVGYNMSVIFIMSQINVGTRQYDWDCGVFIQVTCDLI